MTPKKPGQGQGCGRGGKTFKTNALMVNELSGPSHPTKVTGPGNKEVVSIKTGLLRPAHPLKVSGEQFVNTFTCDALTSNGNELYDPPSNQGRPTLTQTVMGRQRSSLI